MADLGPQSLGRASCPVCGESVRVNRSGRLRFHANPLGNRRGRCPGSREPAPGGSVSLRRLADGVIIQVRHAPGTFADEAVTEELVLLDVEWDELVGRIAVGDGYEVTLCLACRHPGGAHITGAGCKLCQDCPGWDGERDGWWSDRLVRWLSRAAAL